MADRQLCIAIIAPMLVNAVLIGILFAFIKAKFDGIDRRFDDMRDLGCAKFRERPLDRRL